VWGRAASCAACSEHCALKPPGYVLCPLQPLYVMVLHSAAWVRVSVRVRFRVRVWGLGFEGPRYALDGERVPGLLEAAGDGLQGTSAQGAFYKRILALGSGLRLGWVWVVVAWVSRF